MTKLELFAIWFWGFCVGCCVTLGLIRLVRRKSTEARETALGGGKVQLRLCPKCGFKSVGMECNVCRADLRSAPIVESSFSDNSEDEES